MEAPKYSWFGHHRCHSSLIRRSRFDIKHLISWKLVMLHPHKEQTVGLDSPNGHLSDQFGFRQYHQSIRSARFTIFRRDSKRIWAIMRPKSCLSQNFGRRRREDVTSCQSKYRAPRSRPHCALKFFSELPLIMGYNRYKTRTAPRVCCSDSITKMW
jgi:hypothetical protein